MGVDFRLIHDTMIKKIQNNRIKRAKAFLKRVQKIDPYFPYKDYIEWEKARRGEL